MEVREEGMEVQEETVIYIYTHEIEKKFGLFLPAPLHLLKYQD